MSPKAKKRGDMNNQDSRNVRRSGGSIGGGELLHKVGKKNKEAQDILSRWSIEALGNSKKVKISSGSNNFYFVGDGNYSFDYDFRFPDNIVIPEIEFEHFEMPDLPDLPDLPELPEIEFPEFFMEEIEIPEIEIEALEFDYDKYKNDSTYMKEYKKKVEKAMKK